MTDLGDTNEPSALEFPILGNHALDPYIVYVIAMSSPIPLAQNS